MQTMSTDPQSSYYPNPGAGTHQPTTSFYIPNTEFTMPVRNPAPQYGGPRINQQFINQQMPNGYPPPPYYPAHYLPAAPFVSTGAPRGSTPYIQLLRPSNENVVNPSHYIQSGAYPYAPTAPNMASPPPMYPQQFFQPNFQMQPNYGPIPTQAMPNQQVPPQQQQQQQYSIPTGAPQPTQMYQTQPTQHQPVIDQSNVPTSQPSLPPTISSTHPYAQSSASTGQQPEKRQRKPLAIVDPVSHKALEVTTQSTSSASTSTNSSTTTTETRPTETTTDSTIVNPKPTNDPNKTQVQQDFRHQIAKLISDNPTTATDKNTNQLSSSSVAPPGSNDDPPGAAPTKQHSHKQSEPVVTQSTSSASSSRSGSISRPKSPTNDSKSSDQPQPAYPGIRTRTLTDDKINPKSTQDEKRERSDSQKQQPQPEIDETNNLQSTTDEPTVTKTEEEIFSNLPDVQPTPPLSAAASLECVTPPQTPTPVTISEKAQSTAAAAAPNQRLRYDRHELLRIRDSSSALPIPQLPDLDIVVNNNNNNNNNNRRDNARSSHPNYTGTNSQGRINTPFHRQLSSSNHPSLTRYQNNQTNTSSDSRRKQGIYLSNEPDFSNRVENPYKPIDTTKLDASNKVLRDCKAILNKVTPQTFEKLQKQLEALEIDRYERLEGMINIFFSKAVDEPAFSFLYAKLCKQFQKKQVTVPGEDGKTVTHYFRQILLTRCQKEFENDYRQEIEYEKRKNEVETIADDKKRKEEAEKLEEDLVKAKRRKLGNIFFIGELFKLQMLTDTIMYDCIEYLLRDKSDEESLECLCRLLRTIGKELDGKANEKAANKQNLEKHYRELDNIVREHKTSARIRFMIQDLVELRHAAWVARRAEAKPTTIDEIHEQERIKREQQEREQERERQQRRDQNRGTVIGSAYSSNNQQQYNDGRGSRGSGIKQQTNRNDEERVENRFNVNSVRQLQSNDKRGQGPLAMSLAPKVTWTKGSGIEKKLEEDRSFTNRASKPPAGPVQQFKKLGSAQGSANYPLQRQSSRELARENSQRDRENALQALRKATTGSGVNSPINTVGTSSMNNSREGSRNVSREQSRNASRESSVSERTSNVSLSTQMSKSSINESLTVINPDPSNTTFDEEKTQARVHSLIEEYTENYSELIDRPVKEALEDLAAFRTPSIDQQALIVRELFTNVLEAKPRARKAVGHLLDAALNEEILSTDAFLSGFKMIVDDAPDYAVDIPLIWQYIGEIIGALIGAPTSNMSLLKPILQFVPEEKSKQVFQYIIRYATEFSSESRIQTFWQLSGFSLTDLIKSDLVDVSFANEFDWLFDTPQSEPLTPQSKENNSPRADPQLVRLFKSVNDQGTAVNDPEIITYIREHMDPSEKFYIRNIVLSYLEACLINRDPQKKIQEDIAKRRMTVLNAIIEHKPEAEIQAVYAIQNFVNKLEHPPSMERQNLDY
jgi:translation initiation factor 4G